MIKVVDKIFAVLEAIVMSAPRPSTPQALALRLNINRATCSRLLKILLDSGYIIRYSRKMGYLPGPKILTLSNMAAFEEHLLSKVRPVIDRCSKNLKNSVLISRIYDGQRYVLYHQNGNPDVRIVFTGLSCNDIFSTATGLMLAAHLDKNGQIALHRSQQQSGAEFFDFTADVSDALALLDKIRADKFFACEKNTSQWIYACPVYENGKFTAALGISIPRSEYTAAYDKKIRRVMHEAAQEISSELSTLHIIG